MERVNDEQKENHDIKPILSCFNDTKNYVNQTNDQISAHKPLKTSSEVNILRFFNVLYDL